MILDQGSGDTLESFSIPRTFWSASHYAYRCDHQTVRKIPLAKPQTRTRYRTSHTLVDRKNLRRWIVEWTAFLGHRMDQTGIIHSLNPAWPTVMTITIDVGQCVLPIFQGVHSPIQHRVHHIELTPSCNTLVFWLNIVEDPKHITIKGAINPSKFTHIVRGYP